MINPFKEVNWQPDTAAKRKFAKSLIIGFPIIAALFLIAGWISKGTWNLDFPLKLGGIGAAAGALFWLVPAIAGPFYKAWYAIACCIGFVLSNVLLGGFYYTLLTGIGLLRRTIGKPPIRKELDRSAATYWLDADQPTDPKRYFSQF